MALAYRVYLPRYAGTAILPPLEKNPKCSPDGHGVYKLDESPCTGNVNSVEWTTGSEWSTGVPRPQIYNLLGSTIARYSISTQKKLVGAT